MNRDYRCLLNPETISLLEEIETFLGAEVLVEVDRDRRDTLACDIKMFSATIFTPREDYFPDDSVFHELLHLKRFCVEGIPRVLICENYNDWEPDFETRLVALDNNLEHFVIVPKDIRHSSNRKTYWETVILNRIRSPNVQRLDALIYWAFARHISPESSTFEETDNVIVALNLRETAEKMHQDIIENFDNKESLVEACLSHSDVPKDAICLIYSDFKTKQRTERSLALS